MELFIGVLSFVIGWQVIDGLICRAEIKEEIKRSKQEKLKK